MPSWRNGPRTTASIRGISDGRMSPRISSWILAARPATLWAAVAPVLVGTALAQRAGAFRWDAFVVTMVAALLIQIGVNFANDVADAIAERALRWMLAVRQGEALLVKLHDLLLPYREGSCDVSVQYIGDQASARLSLGPDWAVRPSRELRDKLKELLGSRNVRMLYAPSREIM